MADIKLMIVDDEIDFGEALAERLEIRGIIVQTAASGTEALKALGSFLPDVVLLDLKMPDMSGFEVLAELKTRFPAIAVIMLTGHGAASGGTDSMELGAFDFLMKPIELSELITKINEAYEHSRAH